MTLLEKVRQLQAHVLMGNLLEAQAYAEDINDTLVDALNAEEDAKQGEGEDDE